MSHDAGLPAEIFAATLDLLEEWTSLSSPSHDLAGLDAMARRLATDFAGAGLAARVETRQGADGEELPVLLAGDAAGEDEGRLLLVGHLDTVLAAAPPRRDGEKLVATGAIDMKGGLAAFWGALRLLASRDRPLPPGLLLVVVPDEEVGGPIAHGEMTRWGAGARAVWVLEPGAADGDGETLVAARRGMVDWRLEVAGEAAHAGNDFWSGRSALVAAAEWASAVAGLSRRGDGPTVNPARLVAGSADFVENLAAQAARLGTPAQLNVVPDRAVVEGEMRFLRAEEGQELVAHLRRQAADVAAARGVAARLETLVTVPPLPPPGAEGRALAERAVELAAARGWRLRVERDRGGISFPNFLPEPGAVPVLDGLGPVGGGMHTREEHVRLVSLERRVLLLADLLG